MSRILLKPYIRRILVMIYQCRDLSFFFGLIYSSLVRWRFKECGTGLRLTVSTVITAPQNITIGKNFVSMGNLYLYANGDGEINIGDNCDVNTNVQLGAGYGKIDIGNDVMIASNVVLRAANHGIERNEIAMKYQAAERGVIVIENDVWIGSNAVILANVTIATGTVVAAGAVVTKSTDPYSIVAGIPARKIRERT